MCVLCTGELTCRLVFQRDFVLHRRLLSSQALVVISRALAMFAIQHCNNQFVYREPNTNAVFVLNFIAIESARDLPLQDDFNRPPDRIRLEVYGVRAIGKDIGLDLISMLSKVIDSAAITALAERLSKTAKLRLTAADVEFLTPHGGQPNDTMRLRLPRVIVDKGLFLAYLKQHLRHYLLPYLGMDDSKTESKTAENKVNQRKSPTPVPAEADVDDVSKQQSEEPPPPTTKPVPEPALTKPQAPRDDFDFIYSHGATVRGVRQQRFKQSTAQVRRTDRDNSVRDQVTAAVGRGIALISAQIHSAAGTVDSGSTMQEDEGTSSSTLNTSTISVPGNTVGLVDTSVTSLDCSWQDIGGDIEGGTRLPASPVKTSAAVVPDALHQPLDWASIVGEMRKKFEDWDLERPPDWLSDAKRVEDDDGATLTISIWLRGGLKLHALINRIVQSAKQVCTPCSDVF